MSGAFVMIALVISVIAIAVVLAPLRGKHEDAPAASTPRDPAAEYKDALLALRDLDFDHELGVVAEDDYQRLREELVATAAQAMPKKKSRRAAGAPQRSVRPKEKATPDVGSSGCECPQCGRAFQPDHLFCGGCGSRLSAA